MAWVDKTIEDLGCVVTGKTPSTKNRDFYDGDFPFVTPTDLDWDSYYVRETHSTVTDAAKSILKNHFVPKNSIFFTCIASIGKMGIASQECLTNQQINSIITNEDNDPKFIYYLLRRYAESVISIGLGGGSAVPIINKNNFSRIKVKLPCDKNTQKKISSILSNYDNLIENNRRRIALLEESARLLYREWFVHFRFPKNSISKDCQTLPKGWKRISAYEIADILSGGTPRTTTEVYWSEEIPFFTPKDAGANWYAYETEKSISEEGLNNCNSKLYPKDTIFITARGTVGKVRLAQRDMAMNQSCYALRSKAKNISHYFLFLSVLEGVNQLKQRATGAVFDTIVVDTFKFMELTIPPDDLLFDFNELCEPIFNQISILSKQNNSLAKARNLLLPRLMDGRIAV